MNYGQQLWTKQVQSACEGLAWPATQVGYNAWQFGLHADESWPVAMHLADHWLIFETPLGNGHASGNLKSLLKKKPTPLDGPSIGDFSEWNAELPGGVRFALAGAAALVYLRAELPLVEEMDLAGRLGAVCAGFESARLKTEGAAAATKDLNDCKVSQGDLAALCHETGWSCVERPAGRRTVELETPGDFYQAEIEERCGRVHIAVEIAPPAPASTLCGQSLAVFLLATATVLRFARPVLNRKDDQIGARLEVVFDQWPAAQELGHALTALSLGCRGAGREAATLQQDDEVARKYLALWEHHLSAPKWPDSVAHEESNINQGSGWSRERGEVWVQQ